MFHFVVKPIGIENLVGLFGGRERENRNFSDFDRDEQIVVRFDVPIDWGLPLLCDDHVPKSFLKIFKNKNGFSLRWIFIFLGFFLVFYVFFKF